MVAAIDQPGQGEVARPDLQQPIPFEFRAARESPAWCRTTATTEIPSNTRLRGHRNPGQLKIHFSNANGRGGHTSTGAYSMRVGRPPLALGVARAPGPAWAPRDENDRGSVAAWSWRLGRGRKGRAYAPSAGCQKVSASHPRASYPWSAGGECPGKPRPAVVASAMKNLDAIPLDSVGRRPWWLPRPRGPSSASSRSRRSHLGIALARQRPSPPGRDPLLVERQPDQMPDLPLPRLGLVDLGPAGRHPTQCLDDAMAPV